MNPPLHYQGTERFTGLAQLYAKCRPSYPESAIDYILERCDLTPGSLVVDVGSGTGISARLLAERGLHVIGIEPNADMRHKAETAIRVPGVPVPDYRAGQAETTGLANGSADAVLSAQAFHWFDAELALREFHRLLKPGGWVALMWNERDTADPGTAAYGKAVLQSTPEAAVVEGQRARAGEVLLTHPLFENAERRVFAGQQVVDEEGLLGRAFSATYAPKESAAIQSFAEELQAIFARFQQGGRMTIRYETSVYCARRVGG